MQRPQQELEQQQPSHYRKKQQQPSHYRKKHNNNQVITVKNITTASRI